MEKQSTSELRKFGITLGLLFGILIGVSFPLILDAQLRSWPFVVMATLIGVSILRPSVLLLIYVPWMKLAKVLEKTSTLLCLSAVFYLLITPLSLFFRFTGRNVLKLKQVEGADTYRLAPDSIHRDASHMKGLY
jgi:hypothetical protein